MEYEVIIGIEVHAEELDTPDTTPEIDEDKSIISADANVVGTPGSGFGPHGEGYFRLTAFNTKENTIEAIERIKNLFLQ